MLSEIQKREIIMNTVGEYIGIANPMLTTGQTSQLLEYLEDALACHQVIGKKVIKKYPLTVEEQEAMLTERDGG